MRLFVNLGGSSVNQLNFKKGPVYIGRQMGSQVLLPDKTVSRQHAVFYTTRDGTWILEDLGSANKTYVNNEPIAKRELNDGDVIQVADFSIEVYLSDEARKEEATYMEDTLAGIKHDLHTVERKPEASDAPPIKFAAKKILMLAKAAHEIAGVKSVAELQSKLQDIMLDQLAALHAWVSLRKDPNGPMECDGAKKLSAETIERLELALPQSLAEAEEKHHYLLVHQLPRQISSKGVRSVIIAPIMKNESCYGILYAENSTERPHYGLEDIDYLMLLSIQAAVAIDKL